MSNRANIEQQTRITRHNGKEYKTIDIFDDYEQGSLSIEEFEEKPLNILRYVLREQKDSFCSGIDMVIENVISWKNGMWIEGYWYTWEQIKPIFEEFDLIG